MSVETVVKGGRTCFYCYQHLEPSVPALEWLGSTGEVWLHPRCWPLLATRLFRDLHEVEIMASRRCALCEQPWTEGEAVDTVVLPDQVNHGPGTGRAHVDCVLDLTGALVDVLQAYNPVDLFDWLRPKRAACLACRSENVAFLAAQAPQPPIRLATPGEQDTVTNRAYAAHLGMSLDEMVSSRNQFDAARGDPIEARSDYELGHFVVTCGDCAHITKYAILRRPGGRHEIAAVDLGEVRPLDDLASG